MGLGPKKMNRKFQQNKLILVNFFSKQKSALLLKKRKFDFDFYIFLR